MTRGFFMRTLFNLMKNFLWKMWLMVVHTLLLVWIALNLLSRLFQQKRGSG